VKDDRRYLAVRDAVIDTHLLVKGNSEVKQFASASSTIAEARSVRAAKLIANALNIYKPRKRVRSQGC
jgi:hypothetical protein